MKLCLIEDCPSPIHSRGLCGSHYTKYSKLGQLESVALPSKAKTVPQHRLTNKDEEAKTADCAVCGPNVPILLRKSRNYWICRVKNLESKRGFWKTQSPLVYQSSVITEDGLCAVCKREPATQLDHCHSSGAVRGLLCRNCNLGLGYFSDDIDRLLSAIDYLTRK